MRPRAVGRVRSEPLRLKSLLAVRKLTERRVRCRRGAKHPLQEAGPVRPQRDEVTRRPDQERGTANGPLQGEGFGHVRLSALIGAQG